MTKPIAAVVDNSLSARVVRRVPMLYRDGGCPSDDRPRHVRAASGVAWCDGRLVVIQDDVNVIALVSPETGVADAISLPAGHGGARTFDDVRGNKRHKLDLESLVVLRDTDGLGPGRHLLALGSGSIRERDFVLQVTLGHQGFPGTPVVQKILAHSFYDSLRACTLFSGSELNIEGATLLANRSQLRLFQRGNGASRGELRPVTATCEVSLPRFVNYLADPWSSAPPPPTHVRHYDLGTIDGVPLTFTDGTDHDGKSYYLAAAEDSPDATSDGAVVGVAIGAIDADGGARYTLLRGETSARFTAKGEGLALDPNDSRRAWIVLDCDDPNAAADLCTVDLTGF